MALPLHPDHDALLRWRASWTQSFHDRGLAEALAPHLGDEGVAALSPSLTAFGATVAQVVDPAVATMESERGWPRLVPRDALGREVQEVAFHPLYRDAGRAIWASGLLAAGADARRGFEVAALSFLLAHAGEGGHACPIACTLGLIRALRQHGSPELRARFLPALTAIDYDRAQRAAQWLTEIQGGSDVGANTVEARPDGALPGAWRISGEKWFCSVADAEQIAVTARVPSGAPGTAGLGLFLLPRRREDGTPNGLHVWRLKDKLGSRCMATGEVALRDALAWPIGAVEDGFKIAVGVVLNTSRWANALACAGAMQRAYGIAAGYARFRRAFGQRIADLPSLQQALAEIKAEAQAALASTLELTAALEPSGGDEDGAWFRFLVNANKMVTALAATATVRRAIEVLGGNGVIEDFSPLPRLLRDCLVYEAWEGAHDVLCAQVRRDLQRMGLDVVLHRVQWLLDALPSGVAEAEAGHLRAAMDNLAPRLRRSLDDDGFAALHFRRQLEATVRCVQGTCLLREAAHLARRDAAAARGKLALAALHFRRWLWPSFDAEADPQHAVRVRETLGQDLAAP